MRRLVVLVLIASLGNTSLAFAGESLRAVVERAARKLAASASVKAPVVQPVQKNWSLAQEQTALSSSGMRKRTKVLMFIGAAVGFAATAYAIDRRVEDNTPSSRGTRED
jgi:hypothetical protein